MSAVLLKKRVTCPICEKNTIVELREVQHVHRCPKCDRQVRVVEAAPIKRKSKVK